MKFKLLTGMVIALTVTMFSCTFDQIEPAPADPNDPDQPEPGVPTSFVDDVQPIFTANCVSCHPPTANLNLTEGVAYGQIMTSRYITLANPDQSLIYTYPNPTSATHSYRKYSSGNAATILKWIEEGALDN